MDNNSPTHYTGTDLLEVFLNATNYNNNIVRLTKTALKSDDHLLDFGAGIGNFSVLFKELGYQVETAEQDPVLAQRLVNLGFTNHIELSSVRNASVDSVYSFNVLEHIKDDVDMCKQLHTKLRDGGTLILYLPALSWLFSELDRKVGHFRRYHRTGIINVLESSGFTVTQCQYVDSLGVPIGIIFKYFGHRDGSVSKWQVQVFDKIVFPMSKFLDNFFMYVGGKNLFVVAHKISGPLP